MIFVGPIPVLQFQNGDKPSFMPSPGVAHWPNAGRGYVPTLKDRKTYADSLRQPRVDAIRAAIQSGHPKAVIFYGLGYIDV